MRSGRLDPGTRAAVSRGRRCGSIAELVRIAEQHGRTDFDDLTAVLAATSRVLKPNGWLVSATLHPCFEPPHAANGEHDGRTVKLVGSYFEEGRWWPGYRTRLFGQVGWHHRTLSTLLNSFLAARYELTPPANLRHPLR